MFDFDNDNTNDMENKNTSDEIYTEINENKYEYGISYISASPVVENNKIDSKRDSHKASRKGNQILIAFALVVVTALFSSLISASFTARILSKELKQASDDGYYNDKSTSRPSVNMIVSDQGSAEHDEIADSTDGRILSKKDVYAIVSETVVEIQTETVVKGSVFGQYVTDGAGSGVLVGHLENTNQYYVVTNEHVISDASKITVIHKSGMTYNAKIVCFDKDSDIALLSLESDNTLKCASMGNSSSLVVGEDVVAIGNPLGTLGGSITDGIISALERNVMIENTIMRLLQTNVAVNPGNSGGGLFNMAGELVGIINAKYSDYDIEGIAFAIPSDDVKKVIKELIEYGYVKGRASLGISVSERVSSYYGIMSATYVLVTDPCGNNNVKTNDQIYKVNGQEISTISDIKLALSQCKIGDKVSVVLYRNKKLVEIEITLVESVPDDYSDKYKPDV